MRISTETTRIVVTILAVVGLAAVVLLGADVFVDTTAIWLFIKSVPTDFTAFISNAFYDYRFWSVVVIVGLAVVIAFIRAVPMVKGR